MAPSASDPNPVLDLKDVTVTFDTHEGPIQAVRGVSLSVNAGQCLGVVGESGSGKSQTMMAVLGLLSANGRTGGQAMFGGQNLLTLDPAALSRIRGAKIAMVFQDPLTALTPYMKIGEQIAEPLRRHLHLSHADARARAREWLERVRIPDPGRRLDQYPHELSGGMRQRVMIAAAMAPSPALLIADEPTTALDVTVQAEILDLMDELRREQGAALVLISHDMGVIARLADRVCVMRRGLVVEEAPSEQLFAAPKADYTRALLAAVPRLDQEDRGGRPVTAPIAPDAPVVLDAKGVKVWFPIPRGPFRAPAQLRAVDGVDLILRRGETLGVVGESGSGKSTLARAVLNLIPPTAGAVTMLGRDLTKTQGKALQAARKDLQIVFQDPLASLDPRTTIGESIAEPLKVHRPGLSRAERFEMTRAMMAETGLDPSLINRYPHELSGGQNQRVGIARAMILKPALVICDEAVSALDVSVQAQIIDLLIGLQNRLGMAMLFISHDLAVVREICHRVMVLYLGRVMEEASREQIYAGPRHPYTRTLLSAAPIPDPLIERTRQRLRLPGEPPSPLDPAGAYRFAPSRRPADLAQAAPLPLIEVEPGHLVSTFDEALV
jgi:oligopeptide/dipeptide ABC transporter ATP-binding protein